MSTLLLYSLKNKKPVEVKLPLDFAKKASVASVAQAYHVYRERSHTGLPQVQTRGMVSLTTKKMYAQKHTGNARHGSYKAPLFVGGGVTHGPQGVKASHLLTSALKKLTKNGAVAMKVAKKKAVFLDLGSVSKTKQAAGLVKQTEAKNAVVAISLKNWAVARAFRNIENVVVLPWESLNAYPILNNQMLLIDSEVIEKPAAAKAKAGKGKITK